ncbi:MAG: pyridoxal phosphate-dependent aminotransferase [Catalinimonas sp.]
MIQKSHRLESVHYEIRGPLVEQAQRLEQAGHKILRLNIGNPAPFGFHTPAPLMEEITTRLAEAQGYVDTRGLRAAREAICDAFGRRGIRDLSPDDLFIGNGVSEMILMCTQGLLNPGDEVLIPAPDYPLWTSAVRLAGGRAVHYHCDEAAGWLPDLDEMESRITDRTKALVVINPNNPTGAVYPPDLLADLARLAERRGLVVFADEIYDQLTYEGVRHHPLAGFVHDTLCVTFNGLSKNYRAAGFRTGWAILSGARWKAASYVEGITTLASMRLCGNVPTQLAVARALADPSSAQELVLPQGRLRRQRDLCYEKLSAMPGVSVVKPKGAFYMFPRLDPDYYPITDDRAFMLEVLRRTHVLFVQGTGFNWPTPDHLRVVYLPDVDLLADALDRFAAFLEEYRARAARPAVPVKS